MANRWENNGNSERLYFGGSKITADGDCSHEIKRCLLLGRKAIINPRLIKLKSRDITLPTKVCLLKAMVFPVVMYGCESCWGPKNWWFWAVVLEKTLESPLECKEIQSVHPKGNQSWIFIGRTDAETPIIWPCDVKNWLIWKDPDAGKDWRQEKGTREDEMVGWHHWLNGHEFGWTPGVGDRQGGLACCSSWGRKESDTTERLNWTEASTLCEPKTPDVQAEFRKGRRTRNPIANICWIIEKARELQKNVYFCFTDYTKAFDYVHHNKLENSKRDGNNRPPYLPPEKSVCRSRSKS